MITAGLHVPLIPLADVVGNAGTPEFWHKGPMALNVGVAALVMLMFITNAAPHCPAPGVNV